MVLLLCNSSNIIEKNASSNLNGNLISSLLESYYLEKFINVYYDKEYEVKLPDGFVLPNTIKIEPNGYYKTVFEEQYSDRIKLKEELKEKAAILKEVVNSEDNKQKDSDKDENIEASWIKIFRKLNKNTKISGKFDILVKHIALLNNFQKIKNIEAPEIKQNDYEEMVTFIFNYLKEKNIASLKKYFTGIEKLLELIKALNSSDNQKKNIISIEDNKELIKQLIEQHNTVLSYSNGFKILNFELETKLSDGHMQYIKFFSLLIDEIKLNDKKEIFLLLDEVELYMHPNWKKEFLDLLINFISNNFSNKNFHIIFSTHSPFLLSDLPKENVIFLEKGKQVYPDIETFGANIHTLLSHGFFMKDGLMGEFAKEQINKAITILNKSKLDEKEIKFCENIISITGEPILKRQMQKMLDSKRLSKIDDINQKILDMEYELNILKENQSKVVQDELKDRGKKKYTQSKDDDKN